MAHGLLTFALLALFVGALVAAGVAWVFIVFWQVRMIRSRRPGVSVWSRQLIGNPANVLFRPNLLTDEGRRARRKMLYAALVFLAAVTLSFITGTLAPLVRVP